jgi:hypothetical protein
MRRTALPIAFAILAACARDSTGPASSFAENVAGDWTLTSINGQALPATRADQGVTVTVLSAVLTMTGTNSGSYREVLTYRLASEGSSVTASQTALGTWSASDGGITFNDQTYSDSYHGLVSGATITEVRTASTMVYSR